MAKKGKSPSGMLGIREKLKMGSRRDKSPPKTSTKKPPKTPNKTSPSNKKKHTRRNPIDKCLSGDRNDVDSEVDMVEIQANNNKDTKAAVGANTNASKSTRSMNMMTPDMVEALGLMEMHSEYKYQPEKPKKVSSPTPIPTTIRSPAIRAVTPPGHRNSIIKTPKERQVPRERQAPRERQTSKKSVRYSETPSCHYFADNDTKASMSSASTDSTCSSNDSYEDMPQDPCDPCDIRDTCDPYHPCRDDWTLTEGHNEDDGNGHESNAVLQYYRDATVADCSDPLTCAGMTLAMPIACGLLCVDGIAGTKLFDTVTAGYRNASSPSAGANDTSTDPTDDKPQILTIEEKRTRRKKKKRTKEPVMAMM